MGTRIIGAQQMGEMGNVVDPTIATIASTTIIAPTDLIMRVTGNTTVATITPPNPYFNGPLTLYNTDSSVGAWDTSGNIALAGTFTRFKIFTFVFDPSTTKWYPSSTN